MPTQTTITIRIEECITGAQLVPVTPTVPQQVHLDAWRVISSSNWYCGQTVEPKEGEVDDAAWHRAFAERVDRVIRNRTFKTTVTVLRICGAGWPVHWKVTVHWNKPRFRTESDPMGIWTLRQFSRPDARRGRILATIRAPLGCWGEDLYQHLPDGIPNGYEISTDDPGTVFVYPENATMTSPYWEFSFRRSRVFNNTGEA